jgi:hypothetical protein
VPLAIGVSLLEDAADVRPALALGLAALRLLLARFAVVPLVVVFPPVVFLVVAIYSFIFQITFLPRRPETQISQVRQLKTPSGERVRVILRPLLHTCQAFICTGGVLNLPHFVVSFSTTTRRL